MADTREIFNILILILTRSNTLKKAYDQQSRRIQEPQVWFLDILNDIHSDFS
jgi:hypothetical protein